MYTDAMRYSERCAECAITMGIGRRKKPLLHPIPVKRPFQILGVDVMELPKKHLKAVNMLLSFRIF